MTYIAYIFCTPLRQPAVETRHFTSHFVAYVVGDWNNNLALYNVSLSLQLFEVRFDVLCCGSRCLLLYVFH